MADHVTDADIHQYHTQGHVVFRRIIPAALVRDMRREAEKAKAIARTRDPNTQRLQPLHGYPEIDLAPFVQCFSLPELLAAIRGVMGPDAWLESPQTGNLGILLEPAQRPWATAWHRDFGPFQKRVDPAVFARMQVDFRYFHQTNCALYDDDSTWYVPGSHLRPDFAEESRIAQNSPWQVGMDQGDLGNEELERFCLDYVRQMPRGIRLVLEAGDFALYRNSGYHLGCYAPYKKRATLHASVWNPYWKAAADRWGAGGAMEPTTEAMLAGGETEPGCTAISV